MNTTIRNLTILGIALTIGLIATGAALANGGPFLLKYPDGDPAAHGILARLDPDLKPAQEERLRVVKEDLDIIFASERKPGEETRAETPLAHVTAVYTIENPTDEEIEVDFGFPILRGIFVKQGMIRRPAVRVLMDEEQNLHADVISNSAIYGLIRQRAREVIEKAIAEDPELTDLVATCRATGYVRERARRTIREAVGSDKNLRQTVGEDHMLGTLAQLAADQRDPDLDKARTALTKYLSESMKWNSRDVALMVEFASLDFGQIKMYPVDRRYSFPGNLGRQFTDQNMGPLGAIGEQKATQYFAKLAACFDPEVATAYESIFTAWGGDVRERSVDLKTGDIRPREITVDPEALKNMSRDRFDPTIYARVDYLDENASITNAEKASCRTILKNLPVIFTFAPMNLLHYQAKFPANSTHTLSVHYKQYAYKDTHSPESYQLAYVVHPASLWKDFGPINLEVVVPEGVPLRASVPPESQGVEDRRFPPTQLGQSPNAIPTRRASIYRATVTDKTGELFLAVDADGWQKMLNGGGKKEASQRQASR